MAAVPSRERGEILRRAYEELVARADELALLMTLEMGKPLAESKAEILYAADFLHWFSGEAMRITGDFRMNEKATGRVLVQRQPVGPCLFITPWNFPMAMGTRKIGAGDRRGLHDGRQAGEADAALDARAGGHRRSRGPAEGRAERRDGAVVGLDHGAAHPRPAAAQAVVHRVDGGRQGPHRAVGRADPARVDGARRQRAVPRLRGRGPGRRGRRRDDREDAQRRRGVHERQPLPRARVGRSGLLREARRAHGRDAGRPRHRGRRDARARSSTTTSAERSPSSSTTRSDAAARCCAAARGWTARGTSTRRRC